MRETKQVKQISSTTARMYEHLDVLKIIKEDKRFNPVTIHLALTDKCNLKCSFCSVKNRKGNELNFENDVKGIIDVYYDLGVKSIELTGGGDPTMYPDLEETIFYIKKKGLDVSMITNGLRLNRIGEKALKQLTWMRISLSGIDFKLDSIYYDLDASRFPEYVGCSYVFGESALYDDRLSRVSNVAQNLHAKYVRIVPNCYSLEDIEWARLVVPRLIKDYPDMFFQIKDYPTPKECYWKFVKPFVNSDGFVYQCSTCSLFNGYFPEEWRVCHWTEIENVYKKSPAFFDTSICPYCFFFHQNNVLSDLMTDVKHKTFF